MFDDIFHRKYAGGRAEFIDDDEHFGVYLQAEMERLGNGHGFWDEMGFRQELSDGIGVLIIGLGFEEVAPTNESYDVIDITPVHGHPTERHAG